MAQNYKFEFMFPEFEFIVFSPSVFVSVIRFRLSFHRLDQFTQSFTQIFLEYRTCCLRMPDGMKLEISFLARVNEYGNCSPVR